MPKATKRPTAKTTIHRFAGKAAIAAALFGTAAFAGSAHALEVEVRLSEDFQKKIDETYGQREADYLVEALTRDLTRAFEGASVARIAATIEDARPNRPTFKDLGDEPGLSLQSIAIGGADLSGEIYAADGALVAEVAYDWYESDIQNAIGTATWTDAKRAMARFAKTMKKASDGAGS